MLRGWQDGGGLRVVAERAGVDRKAARRYVEAAVGAGLTRVRGRRRWMIWWSGGDLGCPPGPAPSPWQGQVSCHVGGSELG